MAKVKNHKVYLEVPKETVKAFMGEKWEQYVPNCCKGEDYIELTFKVDADVRAGSEGRTRFNSRDMEVSYDPPEEPSCEIDSTKILNHQNNEKVIRLFFE